jgi:hypothetical protein
MSRETTKTLLLSFQADTEIARAELKALVGALGQTTTEVDQRLARIEASFAKANRSIKESGSFLGTLLGSGIGSFAGSLLARLPSTFVDITRSAVDAASSIKNTAEALGISTDQLQVFRLGASKVGVEVSQADAALEKFVQTTGKAANGNKTARAAFDEIGVSIKDANGNLKPFERLLPEVFDGIAKLPDPARQSAAAVKLLGSSGDALLPFLRQGASGINDVAAAAERLGLTLSPAQIKNLDEFGNKAEDIKLVFSAQMAGLIADNADAFFRLAEAFVAVASAGGKGFTRTMDYIAGLREVERQAEPGLLGFVKNIPARLYAQELDKEGTIERGGVLRFIKDMVGTPIQGAADPASSGGDVKDPEERAKRERKGPTPYDLQGELSKALASPRAGPSFVTAGKDAIKVLDDITGQAKTTGEALADALKTDGLDALIQKVPDFTEQMDRARGEADFVGATLADGLTEAAFNFENLGDIAINTLQRIAAALIQSQIMDFLGVGTGGSLVGGLTALFGGARATGGPVGPGRAFLVGERGPELFVPSGTGNITAAKYLTGGGGGGLVQNFDLRGAVVTEQLYRDMQLMSGRAAQAGAVGGAQMAAANQARRAQRRLG